MTGGHITLEEARMKFFISAVIAIAAAFALFTPESKALSSYYQPTASQHHFTAIIDQLKTFRSVTWESPVSMWVQIPASQQGRAAELADTIEDRARGALMQPFCVHIYVTKDQTLARSCVY